MWYELRTSRNAVAEIHVALLLNRRDALRKIAEGEAHRRKETSIEVRQLGDALFLNGGAWDVYRGIVGGEERAVRTLEDLPLDPNLVTVIHNVWQSFSWSVRL